MKPIKDLSLCSRNRDRTIASLALLALPYWGCGGSSSSPSAPTVVATPQPCTQTNLFQGSGAIPSSTLLQLPLTVTTAGRLAFGIYAAASSS